LSTSATTNLAALAARTQEIYERNAARFDRERSTVLFEKAWLDRFLAELPNGAHVLDVGCGSGRPITAYIAAQGYAVTGVDFAQGMLDLAAARLPECTFVKADMRTLDLGTQFDGVIAWNSFFHLEPKDQKQALKRFADHLKSGGTLLTTIGPNASEVTGCVGDDLVYHASLSPDDYRATCHDEGLSIVDLVLEDPACDFHSVLLARRL
jgi:ubiquinone/menaquinone biosynthesis C-methylase UbiE